MPNKPPLAITKVAIDDLFGTLKHSIPLSAEGITFVHGPNGCGKTTVLRLITAALNHDLAVLRATSFSSLRLYFSDGRCVEIERKVIPQKTPTAPQNIESARESAPPKNDAVAELTLILKRVAGSSGNETELQRKAINVDLLREFRRAHDPSISPTYLSRISRFLDQFLPHLERIGPREWRDTKSGQHHSVTEILDLYGDSLPFTLPDWYTQICAQIKIGTIQAQRLLTISSRESRYGPEEQQQQVRDAVEVYSREIAETLSRKLAQTAWSSQSKERSFPRRLILKQFPTDQSEGHLRDQYRRLEEKLQSLVETGLYTDTESIPLPGRNLTPTERRVVALYLSDMADKLAQFDDLQDKILAFRQIIGSKLRRKRLHIDREKGFVFITTGEDQKELKPSLLSSGEQHQVVMFYQLIFASSSGRLFLIDEPEISLHVEWQRQFLSDLQRVAALQKHTFVVATHSPLVINNRLDLAVGLDGGVTS